MKDFFSRLHCIEEGFCFHLYHLDGMEGVRLRSHSWGFVMERYFPRSLDAGMNGLTDLEQGFPCVDHYVAGRSGFDSVYAGAVCPLDCRKDLPIRLGLQLAFWLLRSSEKDQQRPLPQRAYSLQRRRTNLFLVLSLSASLTLQLELDQRVQALELQRSFLAQGFPCVDEFEA